MATSLEQIISVLEDTGNLFKKSQINLKKCPKSRLTKGYIESRLKCIEDYWKTFKKSHEELLRITTKEQRGILPYFVNEEYYVHEDIYLCLEADLKDMLSALPVSRLAEKSVQGTLDVQVKLPKIQIPLFTGCYESWPAYQDLFISLVHNNTSLSSVQKLHYLKTSIGGEAENLLKHIQVTENNYLQAWNTLKERYGNKRLIVNSLLKRLFAQKKIMNQSANSIKALLDTTSECINNLQNLNISTDSWDPIIIFLVVQKLDPESHKQWEAYSYKENSDELPSWTDLKKFLESQFRTLELVTPLSCTRERTIRERSYHVTTPNKTCNMCKNNHALCHCKEFTKLSPLERKEFAKNNNLCYNCLVPGHSVLKCRTPVSCHVCHKRHHSLLHLQKKPDTSGQIGTIQPSVSPSPCNVEEQEEIRVNTMVASNCNTRQKIALLATAMVIVRSERDHTTVLRALIDPGSESSFISEKATQLLQLTRTTAKRSIIGMGSMKTNVNQVVQFKVVSRYKSDYSIQVEAYVVSQQLTAKIPTKSLAVHNWPHLEGLHLADPSYCTPGSIDLLLGVKEYAKILQSDLIKGPPGSPCALKTGLGWILFGEVHSGENCTQESNFIFTHHAVDVDEMLKVIWEVDMDTKRKFTKEERLCENIYEKTYKRNDKGRYIVKLPFKTENPVSPDGNTREIALNRFLQLEKRFNKQPQLKEKYTQVIEEYKNMKHIEEVPEEEIHSKRSIYIPHLAVIREGKETTSTRVVFDASCKGSNGISLNDELLLGPVLQGDLRSLLMRWRMHAVCFVSDIEKMYRMILIAKEDKDFQRVLWRDNPDEPIKDYRLLTVTFGTASAPYLAIKTLVQLSIDEGENYPIATRIIQEDFYVDDVLSGCDNVENAIAAAKELKYLLQQGGFQLKKWSSNNAEFMRSIKPSERSSNVHLDLNIDGTTKALGIAWNLRTDKFEYNSSTHSESMNITKRSILSDIQKLYDPLGWIAPLLVMTKIFIQRLWMEKYSWDEEISQSLIDEWRTIKRDFKNVNGIRIDRWLHTFNKEKESIEIHGFSDASMQAYAAVVYCRVVNSDGTITTTLVAAQTRVAPLKTISLPRLELCGAVLLSRLLKQVTQAMKLSMSQVFTWTDSTIVISWLLGETSKWKPFVANRVVEIIDNTNNRQWYYVKSQDNPADIASRGMYLKDLQNSNLWWKGPKWLSEHKIDFHKPSCTQTDEEMKKVIHVNLNINNKEEEKENHIYTQFENYNTLTELLKVITFCKRFLKFRLLAENINNTITTQELEDSLRICIQISQKIDFEDEIEALEKKKSIKRTSNLKSLNPYLDEQRILRVGGRLRHANIDEESKHPIILNHKNRFTYLIVADAHRRTLHGGIQVMLTYLTSKYWIVRGKGMIKGYINKCLICARHKVAVRTQIMGDLPKARVTPSRPFLQSGVDFTGPFQILISKGRGMKTNKAYIAIFVCMATKAIHLELVGDMTSEAFIGAFKRFTARKGKCSHLWSDQGRNFIGANKELVTAWKDACLEFKGEIAESLACDGTQWHFIPAYSPNFGGLWEAGVKSIKYHLKRILTNHLTFEEMTTILCEIEACLNSRPLCPIDDSGDIIQPLTPGHFLIGEAPIVIPNPDLQHVKVSNISRWQHTQKLLRDFWNRWQKEYLSRLQQRPKWLKKEKEFAIGQIVLIKNDLLPPGKWALGRVLEKHPGDDGVTRVYSVKSGNSVVKRSISKLCYLPVDIETDSK